MGVEENLGLHGAIKTHKQLGPARHCDFQRIAPANWMIRPTRTNAAMEDSAWPRAEMQIKGWNQADGIEAYHSLEDLVSRPSQVWSDIRKQALATRTGAMKEGDTCRTELGDLLQTSAGCTAVREPICWLVLVLTTAPSNKSRVAME